MAESGTSTSLPYSLAESVARILSLAPDALSGLTQARALGELGERLASLNLGLVPVADAATFAWAGHWIGVVELPDGESTAVVLFGVPSAPLEERDADRLAAGTLVDGYVIAPLDLDREHGPDSYRQADQTGTVVGLFTAPDAKAPCVEHTRCAVLAGKGLAGDRYASNAGTFSRSERSGQAMTLIEEESLDDLASLGVDLSMAEARRNVVTRGIRLEGLIGRRFAVGDVVCHGARLAEPCAHLERLTRRGVLRGLVHRGGIRADILTDGELRVGDSIAPLAER
jgi:hypothetical protein